MQHTASYACRRNKPHEASGRHLQYWGRVPEIGTYNRHYVSWQSPQHPHPHLSLIWCAGNGRYAFR